MKKLAMCLAFLAAQVLPAGAVEVRTDYKGRAFIQHADVTLSPSQKREVSFFKKQRYFGALALDTSTGDSDNTGFISNTHNIEEAQSSALRICQLKAAKPTDCVLYMSLVPNKFVANAGHLSLSRKAAMRLSDLQEWHSYSSSYGYIAFAITEGGVWAASAVEPTQELAEKSALDVCNGTIGD